MASFFHGDERVHLAIARNLLHRSTFGRTGAFRVGDDGTFISNLDGRAFDSVGGMWEELRSTSLTSFARVNETTSIGSPYANLSEIIRTINRQIGSPNPELQNFLQEMNLTGQTLSANVLQIKDKKNITNVAKGLLEKTIDGLPLFDDEGGRIVEFVFGREIDGVAESGTKLSEAQIHRLLSLSGNPLIDFDNMQSIEDSAGLFKNLSKLPKRLRAFTSPRDVVITEDIFRSMYGTSIEDKFLKIDLAYDLIYGNIKGFHRIQDSTLSEYYGIARDSRGKIVANLNRDASGNVVGYQRMISEIMDQSLQEANIDPAKFRKILEDAISTIGGPRQLAGFDDTMGSKRLKEIFQAKISTMSATDQEDYRKVFESLMDRIGKSTDGSVMMNLNFVKNMNLKIGEEIKNLETLIRSSSGNQEDLRQRLVGLEKLKSRIESGDLELITTRGGLFGSDLKFASTFVDFDNYLKNFIGVVTEYDLKPEAGFNTSSSLIFSGFGKSKHEVFTDAVGAAFNPEIYASESARIGYKESVDARISTLRNILDTGIIPEELKKSISNFDNFVDDEFMPEYRGPSSARNKQFMQELDELIRSGVSPKHHARLANMLKTYVMSQAIREKDGLHQVIMDEAFRFAINTEEKLNAAMGKASLLGTGKEEINVRGSTIEIPKFRVKGHTMYMSGSDVGTLYDTLGGFDLDDKGIPRMVFTSQGGERKLAFFTLRQPQAVQEYALQAMSYDDETIRSIFGSDSNFGKNFRSTLESMKASNPVNSQAYRDLDMIDRILGIQAKVSSSIPSMHGDYHDAINSVLDQMINEKKINIQNFDQLDIADDFITSGGVPLRNVPGKELQFTRLGLHRLREQSGQAASQVAGEKFLEFLKEVSEQDDRFIPLRQLIQDNMNDLDGLIAASRTLPLEQKRMLLSEMYGQAFTKMTLAAASSGENILGAYINKSMIVGSTRQQLEELAKNDPILASRLSAMPIPLPGQEMPIDLSTTLNIGGIQLDQQKLLQQMGQDFLSQNIAFDEANVKSYLDKMGLDPDTLRGLNLEKLSQAQFKMVAGQMAEATASYYRQSAAGMQGVDELLPGIDRKIAERVFKGETGENVADFLDTYIGGLQDAFNDPLNAQVQQSIDERIKQFQAIQQIGDVETRTKELLGAISLGAGSRFASVHAIHETGLEGLMSSDYMTKSKILANNDLSLANIQISEESANRAKLLLENNRKEIDEIYSGVTSDLLEESDALTLRKMQFVHSFQQQLYAASGGSGEGFEGVVNALDLEIQTSKIRSDFLNDYLVGQQDDIGNFSKGIHDQIALVRQNRRSLYYQQTASDLSKNLVELLTQTNESNIADAARALMGTPGSQTGEVAEEVLKTIIAHSENTVANAQQTDLLRAKIAKEVEYINFLFENRGSIGATPPPISLPQTTIPDSISSMYEDIDSSLPQARDIPYKRFTFDTLKDIFSSEKAKKTSLILGALVAGSFMYQSSKDRSQEDMSGPPLLPGGSAYETGYPTRMSQIGSYSPANIGPSMSYSISLNGSYQDVQRFGSSLGNMDMGRINTTMYNSLPSANRDPYSALAPSF
jgi:hypothetical protein